MKTSEPARLSRATTFVGRTGGHGGAGQIAAIHRRRMVEDSSRRHLTTARA